MNNNIYKKDFSFEPEFYRAVREFIANDRAINGDINFSDEYLEMMNSYRTLFNSEFAGDEIRLTVERKIHGTNFFKKGNKVDINFGNVWENLANDVLSIVRRIYAYKAWPREITNFPDFCEGYNPETKEYIRPGDFKSIRTGLYADTKSNKTMGKPIGCLMPNGGADLYEFKEYEKDIKTYRETGVLSEHLRALIVFCVYDYQDAGSDGVKVANIYDIVVAPAICCIVHKANDMSLSVRKGKVLIGMYENNIRAIHEKNFGI